MAGLKWWGYLHTNGSVQVKRYFDERDIDEALVSPFVSKVTQPFEAEGRSDAIKQASEKLGVVN